MVRIAVVVAALLVTAAPLASGADLITDLGLPLAAPSSVSGDGNVVAGQFSDPLAGFAPRVLRWTPTEGASNLGALTIDAATFSYARGVSADGNVIVGDSVSILGGTFDAFRWTRASGMVNLGKLNGGTAASAYAANRDGSVIVGVATDGAVIAERAFRWTPANGMQSLGVLPGDTASAAHSVSADGGVVVGSSSAGPVGRAFRWVQGSGMSSLGSLNAGTFSSASGVSADGSVVVGQSMDGAAGNANRAFRWTPVTGMVSLGTLNGGNESVAFGVSGSGAVIVGQANDGAAGNATRAFRWTLATGLQKVEDWLRANGARIDHDITRNATATNGDGSVVVGTLAGGHPFVARVSAAGAALADLAALQSSLAAGASLPAMASNMRELVLHGAHGFPLRRLVEVGRNCGWVQGDWGRDTHEGRDGSPRLAEIGTCRRASDTLQFGLALGALSTRSNAVSGGNIDYSAAYALPEVLVNLGKPGSPLWLTMSGLYQRGDVEFRRSYATASGIDSSTGRPVSETYALRVRVDALDAIRLARLSVTPFAELAYANASVDAYTEAGGSFPVQWRRTTEKSVTGRLGLAASYPLAPGTTLLGSIEALDVIDRSSTAAGGQVIGLMGFDLPIAHGRRTWSRISAGIETALGPGKLSAIVNATSTGPAPAWWANLSYQVSF